MQYPASKFAGNVPSYAVTYDDILIAPALSNIIPSEVDTGTQLTPKIRLNIPVLSAPMDTVTGARLAIALAQLGGLGFIHKNLSPEDQAIEVDKVKRSANGVIKDPVTLLPDDTLFHARSLMESHHISGLPVIENNQSRKVVGILTGRDLHFQEDLEKPVKEVMTHENLVTASPQTSLKQARTLLHQYKVEKLLLIDDQQTLQGLITIRDINKLEEYPLATRDDDGRLRVGAAVGVFDRERVERLLDAGADVLCVDTAHGHSKNVIEQVKWIKNNFETEVIAGNIATSEAAQDLVKAGADGLKVGIGPGSICTTRIVAGVGIPQVTALFNVLHGIGKKKIPVIADGGIRYSGDMSKALAAGASTVMLGSLFAGTEESLGEMIYYQGRPFKACRGMGSMGAMSGGSKDRYGQSDVDSSRKLVPEGIEGRVPYRGPAADFVYQFVGGLRATLGYVGAQDVAELQAKAQFVVVSGSTQKENHPHDVTITQEAPNYST